MNLNQALFHPLEIDGLGIKKIKNKCEIVNIKKIGLLYNIEISDYFFKIFRKYYDKNDNRNIFMIKLFCNQGFFNKFISNKCLYCDNENSLEHIVDECNNIIYVNLRKKYKLIIRNRIGNKFYDKYSKEGLLKMIKILYYNNILIY